jgi:RNA polymerase sigma factor (sigma-70 family)
VEVRDLVARAAGGDRAAWEALVARFERLVWSVARSHRLSDADAADVCQTTWLRLLEHLGDVRDPDALSGWLATITRNECLRVLRPTDAPGSDRGRRDPAADGSSQRRRAPARARARCRAVEGVRDAPEPLPGAAADDRHRPARELRGDLACARPAGG